MISEAKDRHNKERRPSRVSAKVRRSSRVNEDKELSLQTSRPNASGPIRVTAGLTARSVYVDTTTGSLACPECSSQLNLHQPEEDQPQFLLGICEDCSKWHYIVEPDSAPGWAVMIELPGRDFIVYVMALTQTKN